MSSAAVSHRKTRTITPEVDTRYKPRRTLNGVAPIAVLTKPFACGGRCLFCPHETGMPNSYLLDGPFGHQAAAMRFDPFHQLLEAFARFERSGHDTTKVELIIIGGSWTAYPAEYQDWFVRRAFQALNGTSGDESLEATLDRNASAPRRNVTTSVETRPDLVGDEDIARFRRAGITKVQIGAPSLDDEILGRNRRGHDAAAVRRAIARLRAAGFKVVIDWMPNLPGSTPERDAEDYERLWQDPSLRPDEVKIFPCSVVEGSPLHAAADELGYRPYSRGDLVELVSHCMAVTPRYARITRISRAFPSSSTTAMTVRSDLRTAAHRHLEAQGRPCACVRCREVKDREVGGTFAIERLDYETNVGTDHFLGVNSGDALVALARLSVPATHAERGSSSPEPSAASALNLPVIRALNVLGPVQSLDDGASSNRFQHLGFGSRLLREAEDIARRAGHRTIVMNSAVGVRSYYEARGYRRHGDLMFKDLT